MKLNFLQAKALISMAFHSRGAIRGALVLSLAVPAATISMSSNAQEASDIEEVVITGVRGKPRTVQDSPVPVDVFSSDDLENVEFTDMNDIVRTLVPTYNLSREPISDGASFIRPATLRGLPTDKTLVLVNGKRRHRAALVRIGGSGVQGPDLATIPAAAIGGLEILRDGAAALYGSDAIAGVMNFQLKNNDSGGSLFVTTGEYYEGDGSNTTIGGNIGFSLGDGGFLSVSGEHYTADATYRGNQYCGSWFCLDPNGAAYNDFITDGRPDRIAYATDPDFIAATASASLGGTWYSPGGTPTLSVLASSSMQECPSRRLLTSTLLVTTPKARVTAASSIATPTTALLRSYVNLMDPSTFRWKSILAASLLDSLVKWRTSRWLPASRAQKKALWDGT